MLLLYIPVPIELLQLMNRYYTLLLVLMCFAGCIKDEPANPEADIETFVVDAQALTSSTFIDQANAKITLYLTDAAYKKGVAPVITVSKGATVFPASGDSIQFNQPLHYAVTSQSGENTKTYTVIAIHAIKEYAFDFETWGSNSTSKYEFPLEADGSQLWSSGNPGAALAGIPKDPQAFPTHSTTDSYHGNKAVEMVTLKGTALTELVGIHIIAGSIFYGNFNSLNAMSKPLEATEFGQPLEGTASRFTGYYKYTPGAQFQDKNGNVVPGAVDSCAIYAIIFKGSQRLNGTNIQTSDRIVARAVLADGSAKANYTRFDIPFAYVPGADLSGDLMIAMVASASYKGGEYAGAIGSKLVIDSLQIIK